MDHIFTSSPSMSKYVEQLRANGHSILAGSNNTCWIAYESSSLFRIPTFTTTPPVPGEVQEVLRKSKALIATYLLNADAAHPSNAKLYVCRDKHYSLDKLAKNARRDARIATQQLHISSIDKTVLLERGFQAYSETRMRLGLSDGTRDMFQQRFAHYLKPPSHHAIAALKDEKIVAFATVAVVDDWVEIEGSFSTNEDRHTCPNNGIIHYILNHALQLGHFTRVSYGLSSIQSQANAEGLDYFKNRVGFSAEPVYRVFEINRFLQPFINKVTLTGINMLLHLKPEDRRLKKIAGILTTMTDTKAKA